MKGVNILPRKSSRNIARAKRHLRIRRHISGTATCPRLNVFRSLGNIYASSLDKDLNLSYGGNVAAAKAVGEAVAKKAIAKGIDTVVFDRGGYIYHGRVAALAEGAREAGLKF